jgi:soluble lytic murein transglycosylase-like protein
MTFYAIIAAAAKKVGVSSSLLFAICSYESANFTDIHVHNDGGSPSVGICMVKQATAQMLGYKGTAKELENNHQINAEFAAKYLAYQQNRYGDNWMMITAAYNAGSYNPSTKVVGCPRNLKYVNRVKKKLEKKLQYKLNCGNM